MPDACPIGGGQHGGEGLLQDPAKLADHGGIIQEQFLQPVLPHSGQGPLDIGPVLLTGGQDLLVQGIQLAFDGLGVPG
jgi:hypothetical protein